ncbi:MAG: hypothetical protein OFPI_06950 [Osedax symbiont Rs2]|nr:MAG: hypothetical protein OFPI_06950 [Osedax symbiont Rs2]
MNLSTDQAKRLMLIVAAFHIIVIASSNYLVQLPFELFGFHTTWGAFSFPFIFLATDLTVRLFGAKMARQIILGVMFPALLISYIASVVLVKGSYVGMQGFNEFNTFVARIALASFVAYMFGQFLDIQVFSRLRKMKRWWVAPATSTVVGNLVDTLLFFSIAFYASVDPFMAANWLEIAWVDYAFKLVISLAVFLPLYGLLLKFLEAKLLDMTGDKLRSQSI